MPIRKRSPEQQALQAWTGARIKEAREAAGLTQREFGTRLGFTHTWVSNIETGANGIDAHDLQRAADLTGYPIEFFTKASYATGRPPATRLDWERLYPEHPKVAKLHWELDQTFSSATRA